MVYPQAKDYTRITEYTKLPYQKTDGWTTVAYEYPLTYEKENKTSACMHRCYCCLCSFAYGLLCHEPGSDERL